MSSEGKKRINSCLYSFQNRSEKIEDKERRLLQGIMTYDVCDLEHFEKRSRERRAYKEKNNKFVKDL